MVRYPGLILRKENMPDNCWCCLLSFAVVHLHDAISLKYLTEYDLTTFAATLNVVAEFSSIQAEVRWYAALACSHIGKFYYFLSSSGSNLNHWLLLCFLRRVPTFLLFFRGPSSSASIFMIAVGVINKKTQKS